MLLSLEICSSRRNEQVDSFFLLMFQRINVIERIPFFMELAEWNREGVGVMIQVFVAVSIKEKTSDNTH